MRRWWIRWYFNPIRFIGLETAEVLRKRGLEVFGTPFTAAVGYGDGPVKFDKTSPGGRPTLQNNGKYLRVNGLDAQTCMECHSVVSNLTIPFTAGIGGDLYADANRRLR